MKNASFTCSLFFFVIFTFALSTAAQTLKPTPTPSVDNDGEVVKISTTLIQLDVIVTDKKGNQVTDLKPEDFEVFENGKKQNITNFSYIFSANGKQPTDSSKSIVATPEKYSVPPPPTKLKLEQVRRTYALVVDDLGLSFDNVSWVQQSLKKFVNEQMQDGDLVAIIRTGSGIGALQSFTSDKRQLLAAVSKIRWNPQGRGGISTFAPIGIDFKDDVKGMVKADGSSGNPAGGGQDKEFQSQIDQFREENFSFGTMGALSYIVRGMRDLPGRKSLMLISEGFPLIDKVGGATQPSRTFDKMKVLADLANRSSVVIYTLDPRGLQVPGMATAEDNIREVLPDGYDAGSSVDPTGSRESNFRDSQQSLRYLSYETGGIPYVNQNNIGIGLRKVLEDQSGYYLMGYQPDAETFDPKKNKFNKLTVKLKRPDLKVRYRSGFYGISDKQIAQVKQTPQQQIYSALTSPFGTGAISLNVNTLFADDEKGGSFIKTMVNIDARDLKFSQEPDGTYKAAFDIIAMTFGDNGVPIDEAAKNYTIRLGEKAYRKILQKGFVYSLSVPIKKPGAYQFRIALRDSASEKVGSASQFVEVPNLKKGDLTLSGIVLDNFTLAEWKNISLGQKNVVQSDNETSADADTSLRIFKRGTVLRYDYLIYNAKINPSPQLQIQARLFRDGKLLLEGQPAPYEANGQTDLKRLEAVGVITLGNNLTAGNYVLQLVVKDNLAKEKRQIATRSVDFEIID